MNQEISGRHISYFAYFAEFSSALDALTLGYAGKGAVVKNCRFWWQTASQKKISAVDFSKREVLYDAGPGSREVSITLSLQEGPEDLPEATLSICLSRDGIRVEATEGAAFQGEIAWGKENTFAVSLEACTSGLRAANGPGASKWDDSLLDRDDGSLVHFQKKDRLSYSWEKGCYTLEAKNCFSVQIYPQFFSQRFALPYHPVNKKQYPTPPAGWMTWYAVKFDACQEAVLENARLQRELLADFGADTLWVDWEWYHNGLRDQMKPDVHFFNPDPDRYPEGLAYVAEKIKEAGFIPALWIAPSHEPVETEFIRQNPDVVLLDHVFWFGRFLYDITHPKFLNEYLPKAISQVKNWGYEALKWDCLPHTLKYTDRVHDHLYDPQKSTFEAYRGMVQKARELLGEDFYMLSCSGTNDRLMLTAGDLFDAARVGDDIFSWEDFKRNLVGQILRMYPYHNTLFYCDPDNLVLRPEYNTLHQAQTRVTIVSLLGLPATFGDDLRTLPAERLDLLRRGLPTLDIHPTEMVEKALEQEQLLLSLQVNRPFESWTVAGLLNLAEQQKSYTLSLEKDLGLDADTYLVYEYWTDTFYAEVKDSLTIDLPAFGSAVLSIRKKTGKLQLVSTSRHLTQGAVDLLELESTETVLSGVSKVVKGDPYTIRAYDPSSGRLLEKTYLPEKTGELSWKIQI